MGGHFQEELAVLMSTLVRPPVRMINKSCFKNDIDKPELDQSACWSLPPSKYEDGEVWAWGTFYRRCDSTLKYLKADCVELISTDQLSWSATEARSKPVGIRRDLWKAGLFWLHCWVGKGRGDTEAGFMVKASPADQRCPLCRKEALAESPLAVEWLC